MPSCASVFVGQRPQFSPVNNRAPSRRYGAGSGTLASFAGVCENGRSVLDEEAPWALPVLARVELGGAAVTSGLMRCRSPSQTGYHLGGAVDFIVGVVVVRGEPDQRVDAPV